MRARLLQSAAEHFAEHGLAGANINRISLDAGYAKGTVYNYFASKEELFTTVLGSGSDVTVERYNKRAPGPSLRERLLVLAEEDVAVVQQHEAFMKVIVAELLNSRPQSRAAVDAGLMPLSQLLVGLCIEGQKNGELRADLSPVRLATTLFGQMAALYALHWRSDGEWPTWEELPTVLVEQFLDGMSP